MALAPQRRNQKKYEEKNPEEKGKARRKRRMPHQARCNSRSNSVNYENYRLSSRGLIRRRYPGQCGMQDSRRGCFAAHDSMSAKKMILGRNACPSKHRELNIRGPSTWNPSYSSDRIRDPTSSGTRCRPHPHHHPPPGTKECRCPPP